MFQISRLLVVNESFKEGPTVWAFFEELGAPSLKKVLKEKIGIPFRVALLIEPFLSFPFQHFFVSL